MFCNVLKLNEFFIKIKTKYLFLVLQFSILLIDQRAHSYMAILLV